MVVKDLRYIGPFLRMNVLSIDNIKNQLEFYARESFKHIVLYSRCGITTSIHNFKLKNTPSTDANTFKKTYPLLCIYKKASPKFISGSSHLNWDEDTFKKEVTVSSNAYMTLTLLKLSKYYNQFKDKDSKLYTIGKIYAQLAKKQLDFYSSNLRNVEGIFIDKQDSSDSSSDKINLKEKNKKFKYSDQALLMNAFYQVGSINTFKECAAYKNFAMDIFNMFLSYKNDLYNLSFEETNKLCFSMNMFYKNSKNDDCKFLLIDLCDLLLDKYSEKSDFDFKDKVDSLCMLYLTLNESYKNLGLIKIKDSMDNIYSKLYSLYDSDAGLFLKNSDKKDIDFTCQDVVLYILSNITHLTSHTEDSTAPLVEVYKRQLLNSGLLSSWPESPTIDNPERYKNFSLKSEDLLEDSFFRIPTLPSPETSELSPVFMKSVTYNLKKDSFSQNRTTFDSTKNMPLIFMILYSISDNIDDNNKSDSGNLSDDIIIDDDSSPDTMSDDENSNS
jgi:hypothetical protein